MTGGETRYSVPEKVGDLAAAVKKSGLFHLAEENIFFRNWLSPLGSIIRNFTSAPRDQRTAVQAGLFWADLGMTIGHEFGEHEHKNTVQTLAFDMLVWSMCLSNMFEACSESDSLFRTWSKHEATMARSRIECKTTQLLIQWTLVTFCHHSVIILSSLDFGRSFEGTWDTGGLWCDPHSRRSHWVLNLELFHVWNMQHHASHYVPVTMQLHTSLISCVFCCYAEICWGSSPNAMLWFQKSMTSFAARNPTNTGGTVNPCQGKNALHRCQEGARDERIPVIFEFFAFKMR